MSSNESRYRSVSRRDFLRTAAVGGAALVVLPGLACSSNAASPAPTAAPSAAGQSTAGPTSPASSAEATATNPPAPTSGVVGEMVVAFSYVAAGSGRVHSPYIAVWVEDTAGNLVRTVSLWYKSDERKYLSDLRRWSNADGRGSDVVISGATRLPGNYTVAWDATDASGSPVPHGDYHLCIEAAREDGPYELIRQPITLDGNPFSVRLPDDGELKNASAEFRV